jgi:hypothetical protein
MERGRLARVFDWDLETVQLAGGPPALLLQRFL